MAVVRWTQKAANDLEDIGNYIEKDSKKYASIVVKRIYSSTLLLKDFPEIGRVVPEFNNKSIRELIEGKYRIVYGLAPYNSDNLILDFNSNHFSS